MTTNLRGSKPSTVGRFLLGSGFAALAIFWLVSFATNRNELHLAIGVFYLATASFWLFYDDLDLADTSWSKSWGTLPTIVIIVSALVIGAAALIIGGTPAFWAMAATSFAWLFVAILVRVAYVRTHRGLS